MTTGASLCDSLPLLQASVCSLQDLLDTGIQFLRDLVSTVRNCAVVGVELLLSPHRPVRITLGHPSRMCRGRAAPASCMTAMRVSLFAACQSSTALRASRRGPFSAVAADFVDQFKAKVEWMAGEAWDAVKRPLLVVQQHLIDFIDDLLPDIMRAVTPMRTILGLVSDTEPLLYLLKLPTRIADTCESSVRAVEESPKGVLTTYYSLLTSTIR